MADCCFQRVVDILLSIHHSNFISHISGCYRIALPPVTIQQARVATRRAPVKTFPVFLYVMVQIRENTTTCGANTINSDIKGPPKVGVNNKSAPGPIPMKNGIYSIRMTNSIPPTMQRA